jgi:hypothetical protein
MSKPYSRALTVTDGGSGMGAVVDDEADAACSLPLEVLLPPPLPQPVVAPASRRSTKPRTGSECFRIN